MNFNDHMNHSANDMSTDSVNTNVTPIIPLPSPMEGDPVYSGGTANGMNDTTYGNTSMNGNGNMNDNGNVNGSSNMNGNSNGNMNGNANMNGNGNMNGNVNMNGNGNMSDVPVIPLPNPGEGGPVYSGNTNGMNDDAYGNGSNGSWMNGNDTSSTTPSAPVTPIIPLPNPGEGGPVYSGNNASGLQGTIITVLPRPVTSCFYCNSASYGTIRFLNAAIGYNPFVISVNNRTAVDTLEYAEVSEYGRVSSGVQTITVAARNGYIYVSKQVRITVGATATIAIVNTAGGLDFVEINDAACFTPVGSSCVRACNLSYNAGQLTLSTYSGNIMFRNIGFMEVTNYVRVIPARYDIFVANTNEVLLSSEITVRSNAQYTIYMFNWTDSPTSIRTLIIEDRK